MGIILNANYRIWKNNKKQTVPAPVDADTPTENWWYDKIAKRASKYRHAGFSAILFPPFAKTQGGAANDADGYGLLDSYDLGNKKQSFSIPTRFGTIDQLRRCVAILNANGINSFGDVVLHQYDGGRAGTYEYPSATGKLNGRWPKTPSCFVGAPPRVPIDPVFSEEGNYAFGDMCSYVNSIPKGYMADNAVAATDWMVKTTGIKGLRIDDTKGSNSGFIHRVATSRSMGGLWKFGETFDGNPDTLSAWVNSVGGSCSAVDFTVHWHLQTVCDFGGDASDLIRPGSAFLHRDPFHAVSYVESPDTDLSPGQQIVNNKGLAYWYILTSEGQPEIYFRDYESDPYCYKLGATIINNLNWIHENLAFGGTVPRYGDHSVACFERTGYPGLITAGNWDTWNKRTITVKTDFGPNVQLHDYSGHHDDIWTDSQGYATFTLPSNAYTSGKSFVCFSRTGYAQPFSVNRHATTQTFFGAADLDVGPAVGGATVSAGRIWCDANTAIELNPAASATGLTLGLLNSDGIAMTLSGSMKAEAARRGYYTVTVTADPTVSTQDFEVAATYTATQNLLDSEISAEKQ